MENIGLGIQLMVVGMATVCLILSILISGGKLLIKFVNRVAPEEAVPAKKTASAAPATVDAGTMQVLQEVVRQLTGGKGHVASAKKI